MRSWTSPGNPDDRLLPQQLISAVLTHKSNATPIREFTAPEVLMGEGGVPVLAALLQ